MSDDFDINSLPEEIRANIKQSGSGHAGDSDSPQDHDDAVVSGADVWDIDKAGEEAGVQLESDEEELDIKREVPVTTEPEPPPKK